MEEEAVDPYEGIDDAVVQEMSQVSYGIISNHQLGSMKFTTHNDFYEQ